MTYGNFSQNQIKHAKHIIRQSITWLLIYADPKTNSEFEEGILLPYFERTLKKISGLNEILCYPDEIIDILTILQVAYVECSKENFKFNSEYRKLILDARALVEKIKEE